jgi:cytosine permease
MNRMLTFKVKEEDRQGWGGLALVTAGQWFHIPALIVGGMLGEGLSLAGVAFCILTGGLILLVCACFMGARSSALGLPSTVISAEGLGVSGARCISTLLISITCAGWFGIQAAVCGASFSAMAAEALGFSVPAWAATLFFGTIMTFSSLYGYRGLKFLYYITMPVLFLVLAYTLIRTVFVSEAGTALLAWHPERPMSYITGITLVVGGWAVGTFSIGDYCRYAKTPREAALGISVGLIPALSAVFLGGAIFRILRGNSDITAILNGMGFPSMALIFLILSVWAINMLNAYSGGIALSALLGLGDKRVRLATVLIGGIGTALGAAGILSRFIDFLSLLSSLIPPVIGVLMGVKITNMLKQGRIGNAARTIPSKPMGGGGGGYIF